MQPENFNLDLKTPCDQTHANLLKSCPPLYPFQYPDRHFYDRPVGPMPYGHEDFLAELAKVGLALAATIVLMALRFGRRRPALFDSRRSWLID